MILRDLYSEDGTEWSRPSSVPENLIRDLKNCLDRGIYKMVAVFHDTNDETASRLGWYLEEHRGSR